MEEELEKEIQRYNEEQGGDCRYVQTARHFARWMREQMMKEAVEGDITNAGGEFGYDVAAFRFDENHTYTVLLPHEEGRKHGDKVELIIVKGD